MIRRGVSIKLLVIGLSVIAFIAVLAVAIVSWALVDVFSQGQKQQEQATLLIKSESALEKVLNDGLDQTFRVIASDSMEALQAVEIDSSSQQQFDQIYAHFESSLGSSEHDQLLALKAAYDEFVFEELQFRENRRLIFENRLALDQLGLEIESLAESLQGTAESLVAKTTKDLDRKKKGIGKIIKNYQSEKGDSTFQARQLVLKTSAFLTGKQEKIGTASNSLMIAVARLTTVARKLMTAETEESVNQLVAEQGLKLNQAIDARLAEIEAIQSKKRYVKTLLKKLKAEMKTFSELLFGDSNSLSSLRISGLTLEQQENSSLFKLLQAMDALNVTMQAIDEVADLAHKESTINTENSIIELQNVNVLVFTSVFIILAVSAFFVIRLVTRPLSEVTEALADISGGDSDLTRRLNIAGVTEVIELSTHFNEFSARLQKMMGNVSAISSDLHSSIESTRSLAADSNKNILVQQDETQQLTNATGKLAASFDEVAKSAADAYQSADDASNQAASGRKVVEASVKSVQQLAVKIETGVETMERLASTSQNVTSVLEVIQSVAEQTNLLALNAAIEAARAGDQGRGFAVVADEVRMLASRTQDSTVEIAEILSHLHKDAESARGIMQESKEQADSSAIKSQQVNEALNKIAESVDAIKLLNQNISRSVEDQSTSANLAAENVDKINGIGLKTAEASTNIEGSSQAMDKLAGELQQSLSQFKI